MTKKPLMSPARAILFLLIIAAVLFAAGCTGSTSGDADNKTRDNYLQAYTAGYAQHTAGQDAFNNGTLAWEAGDFPAAMGAYAGASFNYSLAARDYQIMAGYARGAQEKEFADNLGECAMNLSQASDAFVNAAAALGLNDSAMAYDWYTQGQAHVDASETLLNQSINSTPAWLIELASG